VAWAGYFGTTPDQCHSKGCCYIPAPSTTGAALLSLPVCFYKNNGDSSYSLNNNLAPTGTFFPFALLQVNTIY